MNRVGNGEEALTLPEPERRVAISVWPHLRGQTKGVLCGAARPGPWLAQCKAVDRFWDEGWVDGASPGRGDQQQS